MERLTDYPNGAIKYFIQSEIECPIDYLNDAIKCRLVVALILFFNHSKIELLIN